MRLYVVIDMINDFIDPHGVLYLGKDVRFMADSMAVLLSSQVGVSPFIFCNDSHKVQDKELALWGSHAITDTWGAELITPLNNLCEQCRGPQPTIIESKRTYTGLHTDIAKVMLAHSDLKSVHIMGVCTSLAVLHTVINAYNIKVEGDLSYDIVVHRHLCHDLDYNDHDNSLNYMKEVLGVTIIDTD